MKKKTKHETKQQQKTIASFVYTTLLKTELLLHACKDLLVL